MDRFIRLQAVACPVAVSAIDTDQLIPARFMSRPRAAGYGAFLLHDRRFGPDGQPLGFVLDQPGYAGAQILVTGADFGVGSSREAAVYALWDFGIRCVIAPSFADIFAGNAVKNGLLAAQVTDEVAAALTDALTAMPGLEATVNLESQTIEWGDRQARFEMDPVRRTQLMNGWDELDMTQRHAPDIAMFLAGYRAKYPWAFIDRDAPAKP